MRSIRAAKMGFPEHGQARYAPARVEIGHNLRKSRPPVTYAIAFDLDTEILKDLYPGPSWNNAYSDIRRFLESNGFEHKQGSVYFGTDVIDAVSCVLTAQRLASEFSWFSPAMKDIRMLRIEDQNDLMPAIQPASHSKS
jgi:virulence-associated protein VapD